MSSEPAGCGCGFGTPTLTQKAPMKKHSLVRMSVNLKEVRILEPNTGSQGTALPRRP